jgi:transposase InsO family protein
MSSRLASRRNFFTAATRTGSDCATRGRGLRSRKSAQYCSGDYQALLAEYGMRCSMSRKGNCWDTQSKIASERRTDLTRAGIGRAALADLSLGFRRSPSVAGPSVSDLIGALFCTVSVLSCDWGW